MSFVFNKGEHYLLSVSFNYFLMDGNEDKQIKGYYLKLDSYKNQNETEFDEADDNSI